MRDDRQRPFAPPGPPARPRPSSSPTPLRPLWITVYVVTLALVALAGLKTWRDLTVVESRAVELRQEITRSEAEIDRLQHRLERLEDDPLVLERLAREELHMTYPDEIVLVLPREAEPAAPPALPWGERSTGSPDPPAGPAEP